MSKIQQFIMKNLKQSSDDLLIKKQNNFEDNPYLQSRALWLDIYGSAEERYKKSRKLNFFLTSIVFLSLLGVIYMGMQSKLIPYVIEMQNGSVIYTGMAMNSNFKDLKPQISHFFIQQFVENSRSISVDSYLEKEHQKKAYALTTGPATAELDDFFIDRNPYEIMPKKIISVEINYINQLPKNLIQMGWTEISRDSQTGQMISKEQFIGEFEYQWGDPAKNEFIFQNNPFGFYITNISWTGVK